MMDSEFWINQLSMEYRWHMLTPTDVHWYVGVVITEAGFKKIINGSDEQ